MLVLSVDEVMEYGGDGMVRLAARARQLTAIRRFPAGCAGVWYAFYEPLRHCISETFVCCALHEPLCHFLTSCFVFVCVLCAYLRPLQKVGDC